jgi:pimeloyl-ACP methyl ester carboxylesterase
MPRPLVLILLLAAAACARGVQDLAPSPPGPQAGRVDIGGYELAYECRGTGSPTIVTEAGYNTAGTSAYFELPDLLAPVSRVCAYDRAGTGTSDERPNAKGITVMDEAAELRALLEGAGVDPPFVLVGHSFGGFVSRLFASAYREETAGLLLIESSHEDEIEAYRDLYGPDSPDADWIDGGDLLDIDATAEVLRTTAHDLGDMPLIAMRAAFYEDVLTEKLWERTQADLATLSTDSIHVIALGSGHSVLSQNRTAVLESVEALVSAVREQTSLPPCDEVFTEADVECLRG